MHTRIDGAMSKHQHAINYIKERLTTGDTVIVDGMLLNGTPHAKFLGHELRLDVTYWENDYEYEFKPAANDKAIVFETRTAGRDSTS